MRQPVHQHRCCCLRVLHPQGSQTSLLRIIKLILSGSAEADWTDRCTLYRSWSPLFTALVDRNCEILRINPSNELYYSAMIFVNRDSFVFPIGIAKYCLICGTVIVSMIAGHFCLKVLFHDSFTIFRRRFISIIYRKSLFRSPSSTDFSRSAATRL